MMLKKKLKNAILKFVNQPENGIKSSQTLYECLFYCINRARHGNKLFWEQESEKVAVEIVKSQLENGGFDIGYNFQFGNSLRKQKKFEGTSPELLSVVALNLYLLQKKELNNQSLSDEILRSVLRGVRWAQSQLIETDQGVAIPYAPETAPIVHIPNATSFALCALATSLHHPDLIDKRDEISATVKRMYQFMMSQLVPSARGDGAYWPYFFQTNNIQELRLGNDKIDNYHLAQQLFFHCLSQEFVPDDTNLSIIRATTQYLISLVSADGFVPYQFSQGKTSEKVDTWGFSSVPMALIAASKYVDDPSLDKALKQTTHFLLTHCRGEEHFYPIILWGDGEPFDKEFYPRSDAWVIHACSEVASIIKEEDLEFCDSVYFRIRDSGFIGKENHTLTTRKKIFGVIVRLAMSLKHGAKSLKSITSGLSSN